MLTKDQYIACIFNMAKIQAETAMNRFPAPNYTALKIAEEAGEIIQAAVHLAESGTRDTNKKTHEDLQTECVDLIAMVIRLLIEGDEINGVPSVYKNIIVRGQSND